mmetsp:Transcript_20149/g.40884  ORF Transcript_20149/g.40884 Transcript_20149/m.40884 type:complete len:183 (-) Transcript_20149:111-659(-)
MTGRTASAASRSASTPNLPAVQLDTGEALAAVWQRQARRLCGRPGEAQEDLRPGSGAGAAARRRQPQGHEHLERRCDQVLDRLVRTRKHEATVQEAQLRLRDRNRALSQHSATVRCESAKEMAGGALGGTVSGPFWSHVPPTYETTTEHFFPVKSRDKPHAWSGRFNAISKWGAYPIFYPAR